MRQKLIKSMALFFVLMAVAMVNTCCSKSNKTDLNKSNSLSNVPCTEPVPKDDVSKEDILIIGDSISIGYTPTVTEAFPEYEVLHNPCNGMTSVNGLSRLDGWLSMRPHWKVITFNHGLWDIVPGYNVSIEDYKNALRVEGAAAKMVADRVIFFTTTYVPPGTENRNNNDVLSYNDAAIEVMRELGIQVVDLYSVSRTVDDQHADDNWVHYTETGYRVLGATVVDSIKSVLQ